MVLPDLLVRPDLQVPQPDSAHHLLLQDLSVLVLPVPTPLRFLPLPFLPVLQDRQVLLDRRDQPAQRVRRVVTGQAEVPDLQDPLALQDPLVLPEAQDPKV